MMEKMFFTFSFHLIRKNPEMHALSAGRDRKTEPIKCLSQHIGERVVATRTVQALVACVFVLVR